MSPHKHEQRKSYLSRWGTKRPVGPLFITRTPSALRCLRLFVSVNSFHARHIRGCRNKITGGPAAYPRFINKTGSVLRPCLLTSGLAPFCICKPFYARHVRKSFIRSTTNPLHSWMRTGCRLVPRQFLHAWYASAYLFASTNRRIPMLTRRGTKPVVHQRHEERSLFQDAN